MIKKNRWIKVLGIALSFPSTILVLGYVLFNLHTEGLISKNTSAIVFFLVIFSLLFTMGYYALKKKD